MNKRERFAAIKKSGQGPDDPSLPYQNDDHGGILDLLDDETIQREGLIRTADGTLHLGGIQLHQNHLRIDPQVTEDDLITFLAFLARVEQSLPWWLADAAAATERMYGKTYEAMAALTGLAEKTLREYAYVANTFELSTRVDNLSFGHHKAVAGQIHKRRQTLLDLAVVQHWSVADLERAIEYFQRHHFEGGKSLPETLAGFQTLLFPPKPQPEDRVRVKGNRLAEDILKRASRKNADRHAWASVAREQARRFEQLAREIEEGESGEA